MVGIAERLLDDLPCVFPLHAVLVHEDPHELGDTDNGMRIVQLDRVVLGKILHVVAVNSLVLPYDVLERSGCKEILLSYTEHLTVVGRVVGIEHSPDVVYSVSLDNGIVESL